MIPSRHDFVKRLLDHLVWYLAKPTLEHTVRLQHCRHRIAPAGDSFDEAGSVDRIGSRGATRG
jgi:hypothetical protein